MKVRQLISELLQFPMDLEVGVYQNKERCCFGGVSIIIDDGQPLCAICIKSTKGDNDA